MTSTQCLCALEPQKQGKPFLWKSMAFSSAFQKETAEEHIPHLKQMTKIADNAAVDVEIFRAKAIGWKNEKLQTMALIVIFNHLIKNNFYERCSNQIVNALAHPILRISELAYANLQAFLYILLLSSVRLFIYMVFLFFPCRILPSNSSPR